MNTCVRSPLRRDRRKRTFLDVSIIAFRQIKVNRGRAFLPIFVHILGLMRPIALLPAGFSRAKSAKIFYALTSARGLCTIRKIDYGKLKGASFMTLTLMHFLIVCPLVGIAGFVDSIAGGGGLISLPAYLISGLPVHTCIATNKISSSMGTAVATAKYARSGYIDWRLAAFGAATSLLGAALGARMALAISESLFRVIMLIVLPLTALYVLRKKDLFEQAGRQAISRRRMAAATSVIAFFVGMYDGFYGPGAGTFLILLLARFAHLELHQANGVTKVINLSSNLSSLVVYLLNGQVLLPLGLCAGAFSILGNYLGSRCFTSKGSAIARPIILLVLSVFFVRTVLEMMGLA